MATAATESIAYSLPAAADATNADAIRRRVIPVPITAGTSTAIIDIGYIACWVSITADVDIRVHTLDTGDIAAAAATTWPLWAKSYHNHWVATDRYFRLRGINDSGTAYIYVSNR